MVPYSLFRIVAFLTICLGIQTCTSTTIDDSNYPSPLILIPGLGGSRAYSNLTIFDRIEKKLVWVNYFYMAFPSLLTRFFKLEYDPQTHKTRDAARSHIFFPGWGSTETIEELDDRRHSKTSYFSNLVKELVKDKFYERNKTLRGAPYDFRKAPNENENFTTDLKNLIEDTYEVSGYQRVVILGHSMGSLYTLYFLRKMSLSWKKQYIRAFISVSGPFAGSVKAVESETSGSMKALTKPIHFRDIERSFPSTAFLLPKPEIFGHDPLVITPKKNYSSYDYSELFQDMSMVYGNMMYHDTKDLVNGQETPEGVDELYCIHSYGLKTIKRLVFKSFPNKPPKMIYGDGDQTVNIESLEICRSWEEVKYITLPHLDHRKIVGEPKFIEKLKEILYKHKL